MIFHSTPSTKRGGLYILTEERFMGKHRRQGKQCILIDWLAYPVKIDSIGKKGVEDVLNVLNWMNGLATSEKGETKDIIVIKLQEQVSFI